VVRAPSANLDAGVLFESLSLEGCRDKRPPSFALSSSGCLALQYREQGSFDPLRVSLAFYLKDYTASSFRLFPDSEYAAFVLSFDLNFSLLWRGRFF